MAKKNQPSEFGEWLAQARGEARLTQQALADLCGVDDDGRPIVHVNTIKNLEAGVTQTPHVRVKAALMKALDGEPEPVSVREAMDRHTQAFLDLVGAYLMRLPPETRLERIFELTRTILSKA